MQIGLNLQAMPITQAGLHLASLYCDDALIATYPVSVLPPAPPGLRGAQKV